MDESWRMDRLRGGMGGILGVQNYEGLPPEVGAFNFLKMPHAPWPVHILAVFCQFCGIFDSRGVGVIPEVLDGLRIRTMEDEGLGDGWRLMEEVVMDARMDVWLLVVDAWW